MLVGSLLMMHESPLLQGTGSKDHACGKQLRTSSWASYRVCEVAAVSTVNRSNLPHPGLWAPKTEVEKMKRKQLQRTGSQVFAPSQSLVSKFSSVCRCVFASFDSSTFWLLPLSALFAVLWFCLVCFTAGYCIHCQNAMCFSRAFSEDGVTD